MSDPKEKTVESVVSEIKEAGETAKALTKITKEKASIEFYAKQDSLDLIELDEIRLSSAVKELKESDSPEAAKKISEIQTVLSEIEASKANLEKEKISAYLVPLKYREYRIVQTAVTEALTSVEGMGFDMGTQILMILQERRLMTVYLALRKQDNINQRYFGSLEAVAKVSDKTIETIYRAYSNEFELTETERKNF